MAVTHGAAVTTPEDFGSMTSTATIGGRDAPSLPASSTMALRAYLLASVGSNVTGHLTLPLGLPITVAGFVAALLAARSVRRTPTQQPVTWSPAWLSVMIAAGLAAAPRDHPPSWYAALFRMVPILSIILLGVFAGGGVRTARRALWVMVTLAMMLQVLAPVAVPYPTVDVWSWTQTSVHALLHGVHPYVVRADDVYGGAYDLGYTNTVYPYMPLTLVAHAPTVALFGDYRFGLALCLPITIWLLRSAGRCYHVDVRVLDLLTLALALDPRGVFLVEQGYNEPLLMVAVAAFVYFSARTPDGTAPAIAFLLLPALKQYVVAPALIFLVDLWRRRLYRALVIGVGAASSTVVPFMLWEWRPTLDGILFQVRPSVGFRADSLSLTALAWRITGVEPWHWLPEATQLVVGATAFAYLRHLGAGGLLLASAISLFASFLLATQAFLNYYHFVSILLLCSALVLARPRPQTV